MPNLDYFSWLTSGNGGLGSLSLTQTMMGSDIFSSGFESGGFADWSNGGLQPDPTAFTKFGSNGGSQPNLASIEPIRSPFPDFFNPALFDEEGRYGITKDLRQDARWRGLGQLGAALIGGANSGSWGGMAKGLALGMNAAGETNDAYLDKLSQQKLLQVKTQLDARKAQQDYTMGELEYDVKDFTLDEFKKKAAFNDAGLKEIKEQFDENLTQMRAASSLATDPGLKKNLNQIIGNIEVAVKAGNMEAYQAGMKLWMENAPDQSKALMDQMFKMKSMEAQAQTEGATLGQYNATMAAINEGRAPAGAQGRLVNGRWLLQGPEEIKEETTRQAILDANLANARRERGAPSQLAIVNKQMQLEGMRQKAEEYGVDYNIKKTEFDRLAAIQKKGGTSYWAEGYKSEGEFKKAIRDLEMEMARLQGFKTIQEDKIKETERTIQSLFEAGRTTGEIPPADTAEQLEAKLDAFEAQPQYRMANQTTRKRKLREDALAAVEKNSGMTQQEKNEAIRAINSRWPAN